MSPLLILSPCIGDPEKAGVMLPIRPFFHPREGRGDLATSEFVPFYWGPPRRQGLGSQSAHFWAEGRGDVATSDFVPFYWGPPRRQGVMSPLLILSSSIGDPREG